MRSQSNPLLFKALILQMIGPILKRHTFRSLTGAYPPNKIVVCCFLHTFDIQNTYTTTLSLPYIRHIWVPHKLISSPLCSSAKIMTSTSALTENIDQKNFKSQGKFSLVHSILTVLVPIRQPFNKKVLSYIAHAYRNGKDSFWKLPLESVLLCNEFGKSLTKYFRKLIMQKCAQYSKYNNLIFF